MREQIFQKADCNHAEHDADETGALCCTRLGCETSGHNIGCRSHTNQPVFEPVKLEADAGA
jgi:hypothetical protein